MRIKTKTCSICKQKLPETDFHWKITGKRRQTYCKDCAKVYRDRYYQNNKKKCQKRVYERKKKLAKENRQKSYDYLKEHPCVDCGETHPACLDYDHFRDKKIIVSKMFRDYTWKTIMEEIEKCEVRCANCHRKKTAIEYDWYHDLD